MSGISIKGMAENARKAFLTLANAPIEKRNGALLRMSEAIERHRGDILASNASDVKEARESGLAAPLISRLKLNDDKISRMTEGLRALSALPDPLGRRLYAKELSEGLRLYRVSCAIGVIGVIFESRPDALVQISSLCLKSGNAVMLKGGSEAARSNEALYNALREATDAEGFDPGWISLMHTRQDVGEMLKLDGYIDLVIPRGSNEFVRHIMHNSAIPVLGHSDGVCHVYVDKACDMDTAIDVTVDSKTQSLAVCNAAETLLVHADIAHEFLPAVASRLIEKGVEIRGCELTRKIIACAPATDADWRAEYLDAIISVRVVSSLDEAIFHINTYGSGHTDCIVSTDENAIERFMLMVDSAGVYANCSTRFSDGFLYGFGAEVGIATGKLHARGPMGLEGLCTYKYRLYGSGQTLSALGRGDISLTHRDTE